MQNIAIINSDRDLMHWPDSIIVIGGGRWARVLLETICNLTPVSVKIYVLSPRNHTVMAEWILSCDLDYRVEVLSCYPKTISEKTSVVIVANAANDHEKAIEWALLNQLPVLVEKPITKSFVATKRLANLAKIQKTYLAAAHVFLFSSYIEKFSKLVSKEKNISSVRVIWADPQLEYRHGEIKKYDPGLTIFADCLPHILSILGSFIPNSVKVSENILFLKGGAYLKLNLLLGLIPCEIEMIRNHNSRQRIIEVKAGHINLTLDFSSEPGVIYSDITKLQDNTNESVHEPKPLVKMLLAFFQAFSSINVDSRLDYKIGLKVNQIIDDVEIIYADALIGFLRDELKKSSNNISHDLFYTLTEFFWAHISDSDSLVHLEQRINYLYRTLKKLVSEISIIKKSDVNDALGLAIKQCEFNNFRTE